MARQFDYGLDKRIIDVSFRANYLLFLRALYYYEDETPPPATVATVHGLPWDDFNFFAAENEDDVDFKNPGSKIDTRIVNPVTTGMLQRYNQFVLKDPVRDTKTKTIPGIDTVEITYAGWQVFYHNHATSRAVFGSHDEALAEAISTLLSEGVSDADETTVGLALQQYFNVHTGRLEDIPNYPDPIFITIFAGAGWTYNVIPGPPGIVTTLINNAVLHINVGKLRKLLPAGAGGKKPADFTFKIFHPDRPAGNPSTVLKVEGALYKTSVAKPPAKPNPEKDGRLDYKLIDKEVLTEGTNGGLPQVEHLYPSWTPWPFTGPPSGQTGSSGGGSVLIKNGTSSKNVEVKITFAAAKEPAKLELSGGASSGEG